MEINFREIILTILFFGGIKAIQAATEWVKRFWPNGFIPPKWVLALTPVVFGLLINVGGIAVLGYFKEYGAMAIGASIIMGFLSAFSSMGLYDDRKKSQ